MGKESWVKGRRVNSYCTFRLGLTGPADSRWYGAWWLGWLGAAVVLLFCIIPISGLELPGLCLLFKSAVGQNNVSPQL